MARHSLALICAAAFAVPAAAQESAQTVTVTGRSPATAAVAGFDDVPLSRAPFSAIVIGPSALSDAGVTNLSDITRVTPGLTDAYNAVGYWSNFTVRGYALDQRNNYRRDGLPINAETSLWLGNKQSIDVLLGTSGMQVGVSSRAANLVVKRPNGAHGSAVLGFESDGTYGLALDLGNQAGPDGSIGWRLSAESTHLDPPLNAARGKRQGIAAAGDWRIDANMLLEAEVEFNQQSQPSQPGFSMLGLRVPDARDTDPRINLNDQPWTQPVVFTGQTGSLRWTQRLAADLTFIAHAMTQRLRTDDRIAFPFGCSAEGFVDRYCSNGTFDMYDFRSEGEHRRNDALDLSLGGRAAWSTQEHRWRAGVLGWRQHTDLPPVAFNFVGIGNVDGTAMLPADPTTSGPSITRDERSIEGYARDQWLLTQDATLWLGLRYTHLSRHSSDSPTIEQSFTSPWIAGSLQLDARTLVYVSAGQGIEAAVAPNLPTYVNAGQVLPSQKSHQLEVGIKYDPRADLQRGCSAHSPTVCHREPARARPDGEAGGARHPPGATPMARCAGSVQAGPRCCRPRERSSIPPWIEADQCARAQPARRARLPGIERARIDAERRGRERSLALHSARQLGEHSRMDPSRPRRALSTARCRLHTDVAAGRRQRNRPPRVA
jgi:iron complex outermembrane receptor protein